ncbi:MAG: methyltransferase domain-containing protein [Acetobacteraceae bacterium]|nr:methyltransferase domain-containing protein [Acetobacteraceae bacterium]
MNGELTLTGRLISLWDHLGLKTAHVATQMPGDIAGFAAAHPGRIAGLMLCVPSRLDPTPFAAVASRIVMISGERGMSEEVTGRAQPRLPGSQRIILPQYDAPGWADVIADRTETIAEALRALPGEASVPGLKAGAGLHAGITWQVHGKGPALVLLPFFLAPSQWEAAIPDLARHFTVIVLGGRHLGGVAALEDRAAGPSYAGMIQGLFDVIAPAPGETILDVGCGSGALDRLVARRFGEANPITATDVNPFLLREAAVLAAEEGHEDRITFREGNAERLPFPDASFNHAFTVTVLEECDADLALRELLRVVKPGGRVGVIVRAIDMPQWWHLALPDPIRRKAEIPPQSNGPRGVADASLYRRMRAAGFEAVTGFPALVTFDRPDGPIWRYREDHVLSQLTEDETSVWRAATLAARDDGLLFMANPLHRAVGKKPAA